MKITKLNLPELLRERGLDESNIPETIDDLDIPFEIEKPVEPKKETLTARQIKERIELVKENKKNHNEIMKARLKSLRDDLKAIKKEGKLNIVIEEDEE